MIDSSTVVNTAVLVPDIALTVTNDASADVVPVFDSARLVNDWIDFTKSHTRLKSAQSERTYRGAIKQLFRFFDAQGKNVLTASESDVKEWLEHLKASKADSTVQMYLVAVRLFFAFLCKQKIIAENPCEAGGLKLQAGVTVTREHKRDYLSAAQVKAMFAAMPSDTVMAKRNRALVALMTTAGLRCCEVQRAQCGDMRMKGDSLTLEIQGKGHTSKDAYVKIEPTVEKWIREYLAARFGNKSIKNSDYLFVSTSRNHTADKDDMLSTQAVRAIVKDAMKLIGFNDSRHSAHSLRHTACTLALKAGEDLSAVQMMMRHKRVETTLIYSHAIERENVNPESAVGKMIFG